MQQLNDKQVQPKSNKKQTPNKLTNTTPQSKYTKHKQSTNQKTNNKPKQNKQPKTSKYKQQINHQIQTITTKNQATNTLY